MSLRLVNWNVEWAKPSSPRGAEVLRRVHGHVPEVVCLTETHDGLLSQEGHTICSRPDYGYALKEDRGRSCSGQGNLGIRSMTWESIRCRPDGSCPASHRRQWARSPLSGSVFPGSAHGLRLDASWNARCSGRTTNSTWPVSRKFSNGRLRSVC